VGGRILSKKGFGYDGWDVYEIRIDVRKDITEGIIWSQKIRGMSLENAWAKLQMQRDMLHNLQKSMWDKTNKKMKLTIENPENINKSPLPNLDGWSIELGHNYRDMYEFDIFQNHTIRMSLRIMREEGFDSHYDCTMIGSGRATVKYSLNKRHLKTKDGFLMIVTEIVEKMLDEQEKRTQSLLKPGISQSFQLPPF